MQPGAVRSLTPIISRMRAQDIPIGRTKSKGKYVGVLASVEANIIAGLSPAEALEINLPNGGPSAAGGFATKLRKLVVEKKYSVDVLVRESNGGQKVVYVVGR